MKALLLISSLLLFTACASDPKLAVHDESNQHSSVLAENDKLCENHKSDFLYFRTAFDKEHAEVCGSGCTYTDSMLKNSDTMERVAGLYYLMNCDANHGRL